MRYALAFVLATMLTSIGLAQEVPQPPPPPSNTAAVPLDLLNRVFSYLTTGGTYTEAAGLRDALQQNMLTTQREAQVQQRIDAAVAAALAKAKTNDGKE